MPKIKSKVIFIVGPTASGKSEIAYRLAKEINGEIISADSMQVYRHMDIATAKPPPEWVQDIPHHMIDLVEPTEEFNAAIFFDAAKKAISDVIKKGKNPIIVGGTGLYIRTLLKGIFDGPGSNKVLRNKLSKEFEENGIDHLYNMLYELDPDTAKSIDKHNHRRIIRAIEVFKGANKSIVEMQSQWQNSSGGIEADYNCIIIGLRRVRDDIYSRIDQRVEKMFEEGLVEETSYLIEKGIRENPTAMQALGYKDVMAYLMDEMTVDEARENIKRRTRNYAKRQMTWFKKEEKIQWIDIREKDLPKDIVGKIFKMLNSKY